MANFVYFAKNHICMKTLWLDINSSYAHSSMALPSNVQKHCGIEVLSATVNDDPGRIAAAIYDRCPDVIASTCWVFNHEHLVSTLCRCCRMLPGVTVILGGPEFLGDNEEFLRRNRFVSCVFRGEGEGWFLRWLEIAGVPSLWGGIKGLCYIDENDNYVDAGYARAEDFETLPNPEESDYFNWDKPFVQLETTRGCFNTCAFCVSGGDRPVRMQSLERVASRLERICSMGIRDVRVLDRTFNYDDARACGMLEIFRRLWPKMRFHLEIHPALLSDSLKEALASMPPGALHLEAGIQALREDVLEACGRKGSLSKSLSGLEFLCSCSNLQVHADLIAGLPGYTLDALFEDVVTLMSIGVSEIQLESLKVLPGTVMRREASLLGIRFSPQPPYETLFTDDITPGEMSQAMNLSRMLDFYYNVPQWRDTFRNIALEHAGFTRGFLSYLVSKDVIFRPLALETRILILYDYCAEMIPCATSEIALEWVRQGLSLKKGPASQIRRLKTLPDRVRILMGELSENLRFYFLPLSPEGGGHYFGFDSLRQNPRPVFECVEER